jgi:hypothetical protein
MLKKRGSSLATKTERWKQGVKRGFETESAGNRCLKIVTIRHRKINTGVGLTRTH